MYIKIRYLTTIGLTGKIITVKRTIFTRTVKDQKINDTQIFFQHTEKITTNRIR